MDDTTATCSPPRRSGDPCQRKAFSKRLPHRPTDAGRSPCVQPVLIALLLSLGIGLGHGGFQPAFATTLPECSAETPETATQLPPIVVEGQCEPLTESAHVIERKAIEDFPVANGSINELLTVLPDIQSSETSNLSTQGGEILPPALSISGGRAFENNFIIDGLGNNSMLDPDAQKPVANNSVPGHPQEIFLDASLVDRLAVYDHNVPASYGNFKGGVVDAATIQPAFAYGGNLFYRTTRDAWTRFHLADGEDDDFENSKNYNLQPRFEKHHAGGDLHLPFSPRLRLLASYRLLLSTIPLLHLGQTRNQERRQETFLLKLAATPSRDAQLDLTWIYSPYEGRYFKQDYRDSDFTNIGGAYSLNADFHQSLELGDLHLQAGYRASENSREGPAHMILFQNPDGSWDRQGFTGDIENRQQTVQWKTDLALVPLITGPFSHTLNLGLDLQHIHGSAERAETSYLYTYLNSGVARRNVYESYHTTATMRQYAFFAEDILRFKRLEVRPGLRLSYDDFMENLNLAPRLAMALDLFGGGGTVLVGGVNRYYANALLTYKLREGIPDMYMEQWSEADGWYPRSAPKYASRYAALRTPYADEYVIGIEQRIFGGKAAFTYVRRNGRDEFAKTYGDVEADGLRYYSLNNNGHSRHESCRLTWERQWRRHALNVNATWQDSTSSNESYDDQLNDDELDEEIWFEGKVIHKSERPRLDYNRHWLVNLVYTGQWPYHLTFSGTLKYRSGYQELRKTGTHEELGIPMYKAVDLGGAVTVDCKLDWRTRLWAGHGLELSLEALNLLDKKSATGDSEGSYALGRQFWLGARYTF